MSIRNESRLRERRRKVKYSRIPDIGYAHEQLERVHLPNISFTPLDFLLNFAFPFLSVRSEPQVLLVTPQDVWSRILLLSCLHKQWKVSERSNGREGESVRTIGRVRQTSDRLTQEEVQVDNLSMTFRSISDHQEEGPVSRQQRATHDRQKAHVS